MITIEKELNKHIKDIAELISNDEYRNHIENVLLPKLKKENRSNKGVRFYFDVIEEDWVSLPNAGVTFLKTVIPGNDYNVDSFIREVGKSIENYFELTSLTKDNQRLSNSFNSGTLSYLDFDDYTEMLNITNLHLYNDKFIKETVELFEEDLKDYFIYRKTGLKFKPSKLFKSILNNDDYAKLLVENYNTDLMIEQFRLTDIESYVNEYNCEKNVMYLYFMSIIKILDLRNDQELTNKFLDKFVGYNLLKHNVTYKELNKIADPNRFKVLTNTDSGMIRSNLTYKLDTFNGSYPKFSNRYISIEISKESSVLIQEFIELNQKLKQSELKTQLNNDELFNVDINGIYEPKDYNQRFLKFIKE